MKTLLLAVTLGLVANVAAKTLPLGDSLRVEIGPDWVHSVEKVTPIGSDFGDQVSVRHPDGVGVLRLRTYTAPANISDCIRFIKHHGLIAFLHRKLTDAAILTLEQSFQDILPALYDFTFCPFASSLQTAALEEFCFICCAARFHLNSLFSPV